MKRHIAIILILAAAAVGSPAPALAQAPLKGEVLEVRDTESYTYLRLKTKEGETWAAVTKANVAKGAQVSIEAPMVMHNFESRALKKTFDKIVFGSIAEPGAAGAGAAMTAAPHGGAAPGAMAMPKPAPAAAQAPIKVAKASGKDAHTVAEIVGGKDKLKDKSITLRGQVVKANMGIKGKNWFHLQDGSGNAGAGTNDVAVISSDQAAVGDVVTVKGKVKTDVKVGPGYEYAVLVDEASVRK
ncbi:conserved exported hypothetical protein [Rubrivivax sp. A210]|uniref:nucleotide-binding protein n=1 Tax=Rubrivivax sp. A210 TaxID=2772301 RepID=UPI00191A08CD|nr:nucleotide-binding protein [Rubrivivax sp. A210]CAD5374551.1 conserved exported hypothetical protein [Rubrivivax sp. A210]